MNNMPKMTRKSMMMQKKPMKKQNYDYIFELLVLFKNYFYLTIFLHYQKRKYFFNKYNKINNKYAIINFILQRCALILLKM